MEKLYDRGIANGLAPKKLSASEVNEIEPHVSCIAGVQVPVDGNRGLCRRMPEIGGVNRSPGGRTAVGHESAGLPGRR